MGVGCHSDWPRIRARGGRAGGGMKTRQSWRFEKRLFCSRKLIQDTLCEVFLVYVAAVEWDFFPPRCRLRFDSLSVSVAKASSYPIPKIATASISVPRRLVALKVKVKPRPVGWPSPRTKITSKVLRMLIGFANCELIVRLNGNDNQPVVSKCYKIS